MKSLRFRLPALFLAGIALSGLVTSLIALRLFQDYTRTETSARAAPGGARASPISTPSGRCAHLDEDKAAPAFAASKLEAATGDRLFEVVIADPRSSGKTRACSA